MATYLRIGGLVAFLALAALALWYRGNAISAEADADKARAALNSALEANRMMDKALDHLTRLREREHKLLADMALELRGINERAEAEAAARDDLEDADETVRDYLDTPIPDPLRRLYDNP